MVYGQRLFKTNGDLIHTNGRIPLSIGYHIPLTSGHGWFSASRGFICIICRDWGMPSERRREGITDSRYQKTFLIFIRI